MRGIVAIACGCRVALKCLELVLDVVLQKKRYSYAQLGITARRGEERSDVQFPLANKGSSNSFLPPSEPPPNFRLPGKSEDPHDEPANL